MDKNKPTNNHYNIKQLATKCKEDGHKQTKNQALHYKQKLATPCTVDGHKQTTKLSTKINQIWLQCVQ